MGIVIDPAPSEFFEDGAYTFEKAKRSAEQMTGYYTELLDNCHWTVRRPDETAYDVSDGALHLTARLLLVEGKAAFWALALALACSTAALASSVRRAISVTMPSSPSTPPSRRCA